MIKLIHAWYILVILQSLVKSLKFYWKGGRCFSKYVHIRQEKQITILKRFHSCANKCKSQTKRKQMSAEVRGQLTFLNLNQLK